MENKLESWLKIASKAPSGDNCQPWDVTFLRNQFRVTINQERAKNFLDQNLSASWISLGAFYENLSASAAHFGYQCSVQMDSMLSILVSYSPVPAIPNPQIIETIQNRQTYRVPLKPVQIDLLKEYQEKYQHAERRSDLNWQTTPTVPWQTIRQWAWVEAKIWLRTSLMADFTRWLHTKADRSMMVDGLTLQNLKVSPVDAMMLRVFKHAPQLIRLVPFPFFFLQTLVRLRSLIQNSSGLLYLSGPFQKPADFFEAGREIERMWLLMSEKGIKAQPMTIQSLYLNFVDSTSSKAFFEPKELSTLANIRNETFQQLHVKDDLIFMFRYGASNAKIEPLPRRPLGEARIEQKSNPTWALGS
jgi:hypothetical protein